MQLKLYVSDPDDTHIKQVALQVCDLIGARFELIDVNQQPERAHDDLVMATPTLLIDGPPKRRIVGAVNNARAAATYLTLPEW